MKSSLCLIHKKQTASFRIVGLMLTIAPLGLMLDLANQSAQAQTPADVSSAVTSPAPSPSDWAQFHRDNMQRWNPYETVLGVANGAVYVGTQGGTVSALNASTGATLWNYATTGSAVDVSPAVANGVVYVGSTDGNLYALNASTGSELGRYPT